jgi:hypothetical protein
MLDTGYWILDSGYWILVFENRMKTKKVHSINKLHLKDNAGISAVFRIFKCYMAFYNKI